MVKTVIFEEEKLKMMIDDVKEHMANNGMIGNFIYTVSDYENEITGLREDLTVAHGFVDGEKHLYDMDFEFGDMFREKYSCNLYFDYCSLEEECLTEEVELKFETKKIIECRRNK